jgi:hypothetical protein
MGTFASTDGQALRPIEAAGPEPDADRAALANLNAKPPTPGNNG